MGWISGIACYLLMVLICSRIINSIIIIFVLERNLNKGDDLTNPIGWIFGFLFATLCFFRPNKKRRIKVFVSDHGINIEDLALDEIREIIAEFDDVVFKKRPKFVWSYLDIKEKFTLRGNEYTIELGPWEYDWDIKPLKKKYVNSADIKDLGTHIKHHIIDEKYK